MEELLRVYSREPVPVYIKKPDIPRIIRENNLDVMSLREKYRCYISVNWRWKSKFSSPEHYGESDPPKGTSTELVKIVVTGRALHGKKEEVVSKLRDLGVGVNPYTYSSDVCFGFYANSFGHLVSVAENLKGIAEGLAIVNTIWYVKFPDTMFDLRKLMDVSMIPVGHKTFKATTGMLNYVSIRVFYNGTVGVFSPLTKDDMDRFIRVLWDFLKGYRL